MLNIEQTQILEQAIFLLIKLRNEQSIENWEVNREREFSKTIISSQQNDDGFLEFSDKEILKMPTNFRKIIRANGCKAHYRKRTTGRYNCSFEIRYAKKPYNNPPISASGSTIEEAKARFIEKLKNYVLQDDACVSLNIPNDFNGFAVYWFENFHIAKVAEKTYKNNYGLFRRHIEKKFNGLALQSITPAFLKNFLKALPGNGKTEDDVFSIINQVLDTAVTHNKLKLNPLNLIAHISHERVSGVELTRDEELKLLNAYKYTVYEIIFAVLLYCGLRPNEYKTARIDGNFIIALNSKRKQRKFEEKKIPICSHLRRYLENVTELPVRHEVGIRKSFNAIFQNKHELKDLRKTFNTRCIECKVDFFARKKFMGHSVGKLDAAYTGTLENYLLSEGQKLNDWYNTPNLPH